MTPEECAARTTAAVSGLASFIMLDGATYAAGAEHGFSGLDFYAAGRAGVLGSVPAEQVSACFGFMEPGTVYVHAATLGHTYAADLLQQTLEEERAMDAQLTMLAERFVNLRSIR